MSKELEKKMQEQSEAFSAVKEAIAEIKTLGLETKSGASEAKEKVEKANKKLDEIEDENQKLVKNMNAVAKEQKEAKEALEDSKKQLKQMQEKMADLSLSGGDNRDPLVQKRIALAEEQKNLDLYAKHHNMKTADELKSVGIDLKYFRSDEDPSGGYLMEESYDDKILRDVTEISPIRNMATTKVIQGLAENKYIEAQDFTAYWTGEGQSFTESEQQYSQPRIPLHSMTVKTLATNKSLMGSKFNFDNIVASGFRRVRLKLEGAGFVNGNGVEKPTGFMSPEAGLDGNTSSASGTFTYNDLVLLSGLVKSAYQQKQYAFNRKTLSVIRTLTTPTGEHIWAPGNIGAGVPNMVAGEMYTEVPDMDDIGAGLEPVAFGDFMTGYEIIDASQAIFLRNPYSNEGFVKFTLEGFVGGDVVLKEALVKLTCAS